MSGLPKPGQAKERVDRAEATSTRANDGLQVGIPYFIAMIGTWIP